MRLIEESWFYKGVLLDIVYQYEPALYSSDPYLPPEPALYSVEQVRVGGTDITALVDLDDIQAEFEDDKRYG